MAHFENVAVRWTIEQRRQQLHFCQPCLHHWRGVTRRHNCGAGLDCRIAAMYRACSKAHPQPPREPGRSEGE